MKKFEYFVTELTYPSESYSSLQSCLKLFGLDGWELIEIFQTQYAHLRHAGIFKREIIENGL